MVVWTPWQLVISKPKAPSLWRKFISSTEWTQTKGLLVIHTVGCMNELMAIFDTMKLIPLSFTQAVIAVEGCSVPMRNLLICLHRGPILSRWALWKILAVQIHTVYRFIIFTNHYFQHYSIDNSQHACYSKAQDSLPLPPSPRSKVAARSRDVECYRRR